MTTAAVEQYTGVGEPPYCEMTLRATDSDKSDDLLHLPVTLIGVRKQHFLFHFLNNTSLFHINNNTSLFHINNTSTYKTLYIERVLEKSDGDILNKFLPSYGKCQVNFLLCCINV